MSREIQYFRYHRLVSIHGFDGDDGLSFLHRSDSVDTLPIPQLDKAPSQHRSDPFLAFGHTLEK